eukprot:1200873-Lingulodinium_polyedra.AAC.1
MLLAQLLHQTSYLFHSMLGRTVLNVGHAIQSLVARVRRQGSGGDCAAEDSGDGGEESGED